MFLRSFKLFAAVLLGMLLSTGCGGGDAAPAPTGLAVTAGESSVTVSWDMASGVEYWLFFAPTSLAPTDTASMQQWFGLPGGSTLLKVSSPFVVSGLVNGLSYSFSVNGRIDGGPGGPGATPVIAKPRIAGALWTPGAALGSNDLRSVTYGTTTASASTAAMSTYVAAGAGGAMFSSVDGTSWSAINYASTSKFNGASYLGNFKLVGNGGLILTSSNATSWAAPSSGTSENLYAIASNFTNLNVAVGANGTIITSADGVTWKAATNSATTRDLYAVTYSRYNVGSNTAGTWLAVGAGGAMVQSPDGLNWHGVTSNTVADLRGIVAAASTSTSGVITAKFVAVGAAATLLNSADGLTWTATTLPGVSSNLNAITYDTQFVSVGSGGNIFLSNDGVTWTPASTSPASSNELFAVVRGLNAYSAVGAAGTNLLAK